MYRRFILMTVTLSFVAGCERISKTEWADQVEAPRFRAQQLTPTAPLTNGSFDLRVMAWNIKYGAGRLPFWFDCWGDRVQLTKSEINTNMARNYDLIREADPDILLVEEIELNSRRSQYYDMVQGILDNTALNYAAYFVSWDSRYIPSEGLGRMDLGNAIFSKFPIQSATRIKQQARTDLDALTDIFYLRRAIGRAIIDVDGLDVSAFVVHAEAYDEDGTKAEQIRQIYDVVSTHQGPFILGGDFNELPPVAVQLSDFPDERTDAVCSDEFDQPPYTPEIMAPFFETMNPAIRLQDYGKTHDSQRAYFTHTVLGPQDTNEAGQPGDWNRTLDYLFSDTNSEWVPGTAVVLQRAGQRIEALDWTLEADPLQLSDHAPVFGVLKVKP
ncbi:MAG: endonuclease/exonuclease/phosphatase family protein [Myxococcota bacterium]|nr:endonuclease/exonuclease/phosphatase family protein [Myxococcota bacterium]